MILFLFIEVTLGSSIKDCAETSPERATWDYKSDVFLFQLQALLCFPLSLCLIAPSRSQHWQQLSRAEREKMGLVVRDVGEFW